MEQQFDRDDTNNSVRIKASDLNSKEKSYSFKPFLFTILFFLVFVLLTGIPNLKSTSKQGTKEKLEQKVNTNISTKPKSYLDQGSFMIDTSTMNCKRDGEIEIENSSFIQFSKDDREYESLGPSLIVSLVFPEYNIKNRKTICSPFNLLSKIDEEFLINKDPKTIAIYSSDNNKEWTKEKTEVDLKNKIVRATVNYSHYYVLMAAKTDMIGPETIVQIDSPKASELKYYSPVNLIIKSNDNKGGVGIDQAYFKLDNGVWQTFKNAIKIEKIGKHTIAYYAVDKAENIGLYHLLEFEIVK